MRVVAQAITAAKGGSVTVLRDLVANWDRHDELVVMCWREDVATTIREAGVEVDLVPARSTAHALIRLTRDTGLVRRHRPDVVWSQALLVPFDGPQVLHLRDIGVFDRTHRATPREIARRARIRRDISRADRTVVNSATMADAVRTSSQRLSDLVLEVIPNGLDLTAFLEIPPPDPTEHRDLRILLPQSDHPHKRSDLAAEVLEQVAQRLPPRFTGVRLAIPGGSPHLPLRSALAERGLSGRADFMGHVDRTAMARLYAACDVVLLTSATESFCNPAIEAAAAGRWLVAPPLPVLRETGGPMALIAPSAEPEHLTDGVVRAASLGHAESFRERARHHASGFTATQCASALRSIFEHLM
jgi:glycosyltransferase involved in cell wall biosynthesis